MTTTARPSRFGNFTTMANGRDEKSPQSIASGFGGTNLYNNIWTSTYPSKRDITGSRGSEDAFSGGPSGSGALINNSEADTWGPHPWGTSDTTTQTRSTSGSTSPNRTRDSVNSSFYDNPNPVIGQGRNFVSNGRPKSYLEEDKENGGFVPSYNSHFDVDRGFRHDKRASQDPGYLGVGVVGAPPGSRDSSIPPSRQSDDSHQSPNAYHDSFPYGAGHTPSNSIASTRPGIPVHSSSFPSQTANHRAYMSNSRQVDDSDLATQFRKSLALDGDIAQGLAPSNGPQPFQFNPGSQPWRGEMNVGSVFNNGVGGEVYSDSLGASFHTAKRGSGGRISPASNPAYRVVASPKVFPPPPPTDLWSQRPSSRDPRMVLDLDRRNPVTPFMHAHAQPFYPTPYFNPNFVSQFPPHLYDPYRNPLPIPGYGLPMPSYSMPAAGIPLRPSKDQDPGKGVRSMLLEEFRSSSKSNKRYELKDIYGHVVEFSGDQHGSRFIQQKLETANSDEKDQVFREIEPNALQLMKDVFGNYVIQKFFEHGNQVQKKVLASQMKGKVVDLSLQMYACRVVQKALEHVLVEQQAELVKELEPDIMKVVKDQNGNHVVQKIIELVPRQYIDFIMDSFRGQVSQLAAHTYGCRVVQRMLEFGTEQDKDVILTELHNSAQVLITDQYGNYVTQHVIQHGKPDDRSKMIRLVTAQLVPLSKHKFASNVVEKCIEHGDAEERRNIREQLSAIGSDGTSPLQMMMKDQYGNYVIQKLLNQLEGADREAFVEEMKPQLVALKKTCTGRQIVTIDRLISAASSPAPPKAGQSASGPATPALQVDVNSAAPTPVLTMEPNSPQSSSPPSTNASAVGEAIDEESKPNLSSGGVSLNVQIEA